MWVWVQGAAGGSGWGLLLPMLDLPQTDSLVALVPDGYYKREDSRGHLLEFESTIGADQKPGHSRLPNPGIG